MEQFNDEKLIILAKKGDEQAFSALVQRYLSLVYNFSFRYVKSSVEAEDITQEVFIKVWKNLKKFDESKNFSPWLYKITKNTSLDWLKKKTDKPFAALGEFFADNLSDNNELEKEIIKSGLQEELQQATESLSPISANIFSLYTKDQLTFLEIANKTKISINTVKSRYRRALDLIKRKIED
ncbi:MAG: RNA polymerase sigma factor [Candidatus Falkowbacteria bacterium]|nr:RNA polymerase sigma factor [Candidatus Falkowbacteria bacterium]